MRARLLAFAALVIALAALGFLVQQGISSGRPQPIKVVVLPPPPPTLRILFPEGFTREQMAARVAAVDRIALKKRHIKPALSQGGYLRASGSFSASLKPPLGFGQPRALEGFLFPATYAFTAQTSSHDLVLLQLAAFRRALAQVSLSYARSQGLSLYQVLIVASLIEREVVLPRERALVAAVVYNRLRIGMPLGLDASIRYGLHIPATMAILQSQLDSPSPYNTRLSKGLPPTPIANPGLASLEAAAHPAKVDYLYFIRKADCKSDFFTASAAAFAAYPRAGLYCTGR